MKKRSFSKTNRNSSLSSNSCTCTKWILSASKPCSRPKQSTNCRCLDHSRSQVAKEPHLEVAVLFKSRVKILKSCPQEVMDRTHQTVKMPPASLKVPVQVVDRDALKTKQGLVSNKHAKKRKTRGRQSKPLPIASSHMLRAQVAQEMQMALQMKIRTKLMTVKLINLSPELIKMPMRLTHSQNASESTSQDRPNKHSRRHPASRINPRLVSLKSQEMVWRGRPLRLKVANRLRSWSPHRQMQAKWLDLTILSPLLIVVLFLQKVEQPQTQCQPPLLLKALVKDLK